MVSIAIRSFREGTLVSCVRYYHVEDATAREYGLSKQLVSPIASEVTPITGAGIPCSTASTSEQTHFHPSRLGSR